MPKMPYREKNNYRERLNQCLNNGGRRFGEILLKTQDILRILTRHCVCS